MNMMIVSPIFPPSTGGASTYYNLLVNMLLDEPLIDKIIILTEKVPGSADKEVLHDGRLIIYRVFSNRAGAQRQKLIQYIKYFWQNLQYYYIPLLIKKYSIDLTIIHSSFHIYPNTLAYVIGLQNHLGKCAWISDVRDWQLSRHRLYQLDMYDRVIACSENALKHITQQKTLREKTTLIPVIQEDLNKLPQKDVVNFLRRHSIPYCQYISYVGLIKSQKGLGLLIDAFKLLAERRKEIHLILAGINKDPSLLARKTEGHPRIHYIGAIARNDAIHLSSGAKLSVNLSPSEGMARSSLEAIALGVQVGLPPNVPEFEKHCPDHVIKSQDPKDVAHHFERLLDSISMPTYPIYNHQIINVRQMYLDLIEDVCNEESRKA